MYIYFCLWDHNVIELSVVWNIPAMMDGISLAPSGGPSSSLVSWSAFRGTSSHSQIIPACLSHTFSLHCCYSSLGFCVVSFKNCHCQAPVSTQITQGCFTPPLLISLVFLRVFQSRISHLPPFLLTLLMQSPLHQHMGCHVPQLSSKHCAAPRTQCSLPWIWKNTAVPTVLTDHQMSRHWDLKHILVFFSSIIYATVVVGAGQNEWLPYTIHRTIPCIKLSAPGPVIRWSPRFFFSLVNFTQESYRPHSHTLVGPTANTSLLDMSLFMQIPI